MVIKTPVPDNHAARAVVALGYDTLEILVIEGMVFDHYRKPFYGRIECWPFRHGPTLEYPFEFEPQS